MKLQTLNNEWINTRHALVYYGCHISNTIQCQLINGQTYSVLQPEYDQVTNEIVQDTVRVISAMELTNQTLTQKDLWNEMLHQRNLQ